MTKNNKGSLFVFEVGPSVKFVSAIKDAIFNKKNGGKFFFWKNAKLGGGSEGSLAKDQTFSGFFSSHPSLRRVVGDAWCQPHGRKVHQATLVKSTGCPHMASLPAPRWHRKTRHRAWRANGGSKIISVVRTDAPAHDRIEPQATWWQLRTCVWCAVPCPSNYFIIQIICRHLRPFIS